jgi:four helix bundle protein
MSNLDKAKKVFDFRKLEVYQKAKSFHLQCLGIMRENKLERFVNDQLGRASFSVVLNIAEGSGKFSKADRRNFFVISRASLFECIAVLDILRDRDIIESSNFDVMVDAADELSRMLFAMIRNLG